MCKVWIWLQLTENLAAEDILRDNEYKHPGVSYILNKIDLYTNKSEQIIMPWAELGYPKSQSSVVYYKHPDRDRALHLCGWPLHLDATSLAKFVANLEEKGAYSRAAAVAVFNLNVQLAIEVLGRAPDDVQFGSSLNVAALALTGFSDERSKAWRQNCMTCIEKLSNPYFKVMFSFLTADNQNYEAALVSVKLFIIKLYYLYSNLHNSQKRSTKLVEYNNKRYLKIPKHKSLSQSISAVSVKNKTNFCETVKHMCHEPDYFSFYINHYKLLPF